MDELLRLISELDSEILAVEQERIELSKKYRKLLRIRSDLLVKLATIQMQRAYDIGSR